MNINDSINELNLNFDELINLTNDNNNQIKSIRKKIKDTKTKINKIKDEIFLDNYYKDDLDFQVSYYCNIYAYKKGLLIVKKNKIFYDLLIYYNFFRYLIRYCVKYLKPNNRIFAEDTKIDKSIINKNHFKIKDLRILYNSLIQNIRSCHNNFLEIDNLILDLDPANSSHNLIINNIHNNLFNNLKILRDRFLYGIENINEIINYHNQQLVFFRDSMDSELRFINENIFYNQGVKMSVRLNLSPNINNNQFTIGDNFQIRIRPERNVDYNSKIGIIIEGSIKLNLIRLEQFNSDDGFIYNYSIISSEDQKYGEFKIKIVCINETFGNSYIKCLSNDTFYLIEPISNNSENNNLQEHNDQEEDQSLNDQAEQSITSESLEDDQSLNDQEDNQSLNDQAEESITSQSLEEDTSPTNSELETNNDELA